MAKIFLDEDELYPYYLLTEADRYAIEAVVHGTKVKRWKAAIEEFKKVQDEMEAVYKQAVYKQAFLKKHPPASP